MDGPADTRHRDHPGRVELKALRLDEQPTGLGDLRERVAVDRNSGLLEPTRHDITHGGSKDGQRTWLRCHEYQLEAPDVHALRPLRGHESELVQRQRPHRAKRLDERDAPGVTLLDVLDDALVGRVGIRVPERGDVLVWLDQPGTDRDQKRVVVDASSLGGVDDLGVSFNPSERVLREFRPGVLRDVAQRIAPRRPERERLTHSHGPVDEFLVRGDQLDLHRVPCQPSQPKKTLDRGDPTATNNNSKIAHPRAYGSLGALPSGASHMGVCRTT